MKYLTILLCCFFSVCVGAGEFVAPNVIYVPEFRTYEASGYQPLAANIEIIKKAQSGLRLISFDGSKNNSNVLFCRASFPVYGPNKTPFANLVEAAVNLELAESELVNPDLPRIKATLDEFDFSTVGTGKWTIAATFTLDGKEPLSVKYVHSYDVSFMAATACGQVMKELPVGIEMFLKALYSDPRFGEFSQRS